MLALGSCTSKQRAISLSDGSPSLHTQARSLSSGFSRYNKILASHKGHEALLADVGHFPNDFALTLKIPALGREETRG